MRQPRIRTLVNFSQSRLTSACVSTQIWGCVARFFEIILQRHMFLKNDLNERGGVVKMGEEWHTAVLDGL